MKEILLMYSGGLDSILSMVRLVNLNYKVKLIHFDNGCNISIGMETKRAKYFQEKYGKDKVEYVGKISTISAFRENERILSNIPFSEIQNQYGDCTINQIRCLNCRSAMYYETIIYALRNNIKYIAEGARKSQLFAIEQPIMIKAYKELLREFNIELLLPVYELKDDFRRDNELLRYGIVPVPSEDKCILGMPQEKELPDNQINTINNIFTEEIKTRYIKSLKKELLPIQKIFKGNNNIKYY